MDMPMTASPKEEQRRLGDRAFNALAAALVFVAYFAVFLFTGAGGILGAVEGSLRNLVPLAILSIAARSLILRHLVGRSAVLQVAGHTALATAFTLLLYWLLMILIGLDEGESFTQFVVKAFFPTSAFAWQLLQGLALYTVVACLTYLRQKSTPLILPSAAAETVAITESPSRYLIRVGEDIIPIDTKEIVSIRGADDYAEVATIGGRHLVRMTLAEFEKSLKRDNFIRVHRSHIVNVDRIERAEPAGGGRMLLHMENGEMIPSSRAGSRLLRDRVI
jgi:two-component system LytT family response regulator